MLRNVSLFFTVDIFSSDFAKVMHSKSVAGDDKFLKRHPQNNSNFDNRMDHESLKTTIIYSSFVTGKAMYVKSYLILSKKK